MKEIKMNFEEFIVFIDISFKNYGFFCFILDIRNSNFTLKENNVVIKEINYVENFLSNIIKNKLNEKY